MALPYFHLRKRRYSVGISKAYFPKAECPKETVQEYLEVRDVVATSRIEAAKMFWADHSARLIKLMGPDNHRLSRRVSLHVSGDRGTAPSRLEPVLVQWGLI